MCILWTVSRTCMAIIGTKWPDLRPCRTECLSCKHELSHARTRTRVEDTCQLLNLTLDCLPSALVSDYTTDLTCLSFLRQSLDC